MTTSTGTRRLRWQHYVMIGVVAALVLLVGGSVLIGMRNYDRETAQMARDMVTSLRSAAGPLYAVESPTTAAEVVSQVEIDDPAKGAPTYGVVRVAIPGTSVMSTWPGGDVPTCVPGKSVEPDSDVPTYTTCVRLSETAVVALHSDTPPNGSAAATFDYTEVFAELGSTTISATLESEKAITRATAVSRARKVIKDVRPVDLDRFTDADLLRAARDQVKVDRMF